MVLNDDCFPQKLLIGAISVLFLMFLMLPNNFIDWFINEFISSAVAIFFIIPIAYAILSLKAPKEIILTVVIGGVLYALYAYIMGVTIKDGLEVILQTIIGVVFISVAMELSKRWIKKAVK